MKQQEEGILWKELVSEAVGTFLMVFAGTATIAITSFTGGIVDHGLVAAAFGLSVTVLVYACRDISGAQFNPAISVALLVTRNISAPRAMAYIAAQLLGALGASALLGAVMASAFGGFRNVEFGATLPREIIGGSVPLSLIIEVIASFVLVTVVFTLHRKGSAAAPYAGVAVGCAVALGSIFAGPLSGGSMNPARSFGPAMFAPGASAQYWLYVVGPILGGLLAALFHHAVARSDDDLEDA